MSDLAKYWYSLTFHYTTERGWAMHSVYVGYKVSRREFSLPEMKSIKEQEGMPLDATLMNISYLGFMTSERFKGEEACSTS